MKAHAIAESAAVTASAIPQISYARTPALEVRELGDGKAITQEQALAELAALGDGWQLPSPHDLYAKVCYDYKNQHGAYTRDKTLKAGYYWSNQKTPWYEGGRVVVGFGYGHVDDYGVLDRAFARAVRSVPAGQ